MEQHRPLYKVLADDIKEKILCGEYKPGSLLPIEAELCRNYQVSRITVRRALETLADEDLVERSFSKTPQVKSHAIPRNINRLTGLSEDLESHGAKCSNFLLKSEEVKADSFIASKMNVEVGESLYLVERLRYSNGVPLCYQKTYFLAKTCQGLLDDDLAKQSIYRLLEKKYGLTIGNSDQIISACIASFRICALLELSDATAMLKVVNTGYLQDGTCFEYSTNYYVGESYNISVTLSR